jgi:hypothetical protein
MVLEFESEAGKSAEPGSLMDMVLDGLVSWIGKFSFPTPLVHTLSDRRWNKIAEKPETHPPRSDFVETLLRSPSASRLLEVVLASSPPTVFSAIWKSYFRTRLWRVAAHPVSNFVVAKGIERLDAVYTKEAVTEIANGQGLSKSEEQSGGIAAQMIGSRKLLVLASPVLFRSWEALCLLENSRTGPLRALLERTTALGVAQEELVKVLVWCRWCCSRFFDGLTRGSQVLLLALGIKDEDVRYLVPCVLALMPMSVSDRLVYDMYRDERD